METQPIEKTKNCPYCHEQIKEEAKKCRYCGEWLTNDNQRVGSEPLKQGTADARAVVKGLKEKEVDDAGRGCLTGILLVVSLGAVFLHWILGLLIFIGGLVYINKWYYKE